MIRMADARAKASKIIKITKVEQYTVKGFKVVNVFTV